MFPARALERQNELEASSFLTLPALQLDSSHAKADWATNEYVAVDRRADDRRRSKLHGRQYSTGSRTIHQELAVVTVTVHGYDDVLHVRRDEIGYYWLSWCLGCVGS